MSPRPRRPLSSEERRLWAEFARTIAPLPGRRLEGPPEPDPGRSTPLDRTAPLAGTPGPALSRPSSAMPLAPLERRMVRALARGQTKAESTLDLHGLTQAQAHARLLGFLRRAQGEGHGLVLVVTGRGREGDEARGVLRRLVPLWLGARELRPLVLGFQEAGIRQGGAGALYVRLRRARSG